MLDRSLRSFGLEPAWTVWDDPGVDWDEFELTVVRSAWDYAERWQEFLGWANEVARVENCPAALAFGVDKERYLRVLAAAGVPVVPTEFVHPGQPFAAPTGPFVVKPAISAGGRRSASFQPGEHVDAAAALVADITGAGDTVMVQPLLSGVTETSLVYVDGCYSHSLRRRASLPVGCAEDVLYLDEELGAHVATGAERRVADAALALVPGSTLYARVDLLGGLVLELEVVEPSLYLAFRPGSADTFAAAVARRLGRP